MRNDRSSHNVRAQLIHDELVRQPMISVALNTLLPERSRNRNPFRNPRHISMKCRVETCHLRDVSKERRRFAYKRYLIRKMQRHERNEAFEIREQRRRHAFGDDVLLAAEYDAVSDRVDLEIPKLRTNLLEDTSRRHAA